MEDLSLKQLLNSAGLVLWRVLMKRNQSEIGATCIEYLLGLVPVVFLVVVLQLVGIGAAGRFDTARDQIALLDRGSSETPNVSGIALTSNVGNPFGNVTQNGGGVLSTSNSDDTATWGLGDPDENRSNSSNPSDQAEGEFLLRRNG